jgi:hypothetical protein
MLTHLVKSPPSAVDLACPAQCKELREWLVEHSFATKQQMKALVDFWHLEGTEVDRRLLKPRKVRPRRPSLREEGTAVQQLYEAWLDSRKQKAGREENNLETDKERRHWHDIA